MTVFSQLTKPGIMNPLQGTGVRSNETQTRGTLFEAIYNNKTRHERLVSAVGKKRHRIKDKHQSALKWAQLDKEEEHEESEEEFIDRTSTHGGSQNFQVTLLLMMYR